MIPERIKRYQKWCVSKEKMPLDVFALQKGYEWGASFKRTHSAHADFDTVKKIYDQTSYRPTLFVDTAEQNIMILDIEPACPVEVREALLTGLKNDIQYIERSMSGHGYHLIIGVDGSSHHHTVKYKKWFELLSNHHCTFTLEEIDLATAMSEDHGTHESITDDDKDIELLEKLRPGISSEELYQYIGGDRASVAAAAAESGSYAEYKSACAGFDGRHADLFSQLCAVEYQKTVDGDFFGDYSKYEFGYASKMYHALKRFSANMIDSDANFYELKLSEKETIMLIYMVLKQMLPYRPKHDETRRGLPWLLYTAEQVCLKQDQK